MGAFKFHVELYRPVCDVVSFLLPFGGTQVQKEKFFVHFFLRFRPANGPVLEGIVYLFFKRKRQGGHTPMQFF